MWGVEVKSHQKKKCEKEVVKNLLKRWASVNNGDARWQRTEELTEALLLYMFSYNAYYK